MAVVELSSVPRLSRLYSKAAAGMLPGRRGGSDSLPETELVLRGVGVDRQRLADYVRVCGFPVTDTLPATYPHVMAFPLALSLMTAPDFPFPATSVVHLANRIEQHRPISADEELELTVHAEHLRAHVRGRQVDVVAEAAVAGVPVWRDVSTYLCKQRAGEGDGSKRERPEAPAVPAPTAEWRVEAGVGRAYAAVSGDRNPIHLSTLAAKAFGFRRKIAHGMWTKARCLAQLAPRLPEAYQVDVTFQAPILLPSTVHFSAVAADGGWRLGLHAPGSAKPHLTGTITLVR
jgi:acyl dehydratase